MVAVAGLAPERPEPIARRRRSRHRGRAPRGTSAWRPSVSPARSNRSAEHVPLPQVVFADASWAASGRAAISGDRLLQIAAIGVARRRRRSVPSAITSWEGDGFTDLAPRGVDRRPPLERPVAVGQHGQQRRVGVQLARLLERSRRLPPAPGAVGGETVQLVPGGELRELADHRRHHPPRVVVAFAVECRRRRRQALGQALGASRDRRSPRGSRPAPRDRPRRRGAACPPSPAWSPPRPRP